MIARKNVADKLSIRYWDDPVLSTLCDAVEDNEFGPQLDEFGQEMIATMEANNGVGLAASQVGIAKRIFTMHFPEQEKAKPIIVCNPILKLGTETIRATEGCLSMPEVFLQIERAVSVVMQYSNPMGEQVEISINGMDARVAQHEADHIDGIFFINRVSRQMRRAALRDWWDKIKPRYA
jgi:peptide deformylase